MKIDQCSSCGACANVCPKSAISMCSDKDGFYRPKINNELCIHCGLCEKVCPWQNKIQNPNKVSISPFTKVALATDDKIRLNSSSGGLFSVLAKHILSKSGVVAGVGWDGNGKLKHLFIDNQNDLKLLQASKYFQSNPGMIYKECKTFLQTGRYVLFSGTPCQIAALYAVLGNKNYNNLWTIDLVCHGTPSIKVFEKYKKEIENNNIAKWKTSFFRDKRTGWKTYSMTNLIEEKSGAIKEKSVLLVNDFFGKVFLKNLCLNTSCADCHYGKLHRIADITLGDFWGVSKYHPKMDDDKGTSVILLNTKQGANLFHQIENQIRQENSKLEWAIAGNPSIIRSSIPHPRRNDFFKNLDSMTLETLVAKYCPPPPILKRLYMKFRQKAGIVKRFIRGKKRC